MTASVKIAFAIHLAAVVTVCVVTMPALLAPKAAQAQDARELAEQQAELVKQYMEAAGMSAEEVAEQQAMFKESIGPLVEAQAARQAREEAEFEARTAGLGKAVISMPGSDIELQVTECVPDPGGDFRIKAQASHNSRSDSLWLSGDSYYDRTVLQMFLTGIGEYDIWIQPMVNLEDGKFAWSGTAEGGSGSTEMTLTVNCKPGQ